MVRLLLVGLAALLAPAVALAQPYQPDLAEQSAAMQRLTPMIGRWVGEANVRSPEAMVVYQTERVERELDGRLLILRGNGYDDPDRSDAPVFQAFGVISYDDRRDIYEVRSYAMGHAATATGEFLDDGQFRWSIIPGGPVRIRYTIALTTDTWSEVGEISYDAGATWTQTIDMRLRRQQR